MKADLDVLSVISESLSEDGQTTDMLGIIIDAHAETNTASVVQMETVNCDVGNLKTVDKSSIFIDDRMVCESAKRRCRFIRHSEWNVCDAAGSISGRNLWGSDKY